MKQVAKDNIFCDSIYMNVQKCPDIQIQKVNLWKFKNGGNEVRGSDS